MPALRATSQTGLDSQNNLDTLPPEVFQHILSFLVHPRSHLPGLTEAQSELPQLEKLAIKNEEALTTPSHVDEWAADVFSISFTPHPFNALAATSRRCHDLVESYCGHLVRICNPFNLPFADFDRYGAGRVWPDLSGIVYRRLWLQHAPRCCIYCAVVIDQYPFRTVKYLITTCKDCFYRHCLEIVEIVKQYHISAQTVIESPVIRGRRGTVWYLRTDVEALAVQLYGTRAFHAAHAHQVGKPCTICAITRFKPGQGFKKRPVRDADRKTTAVQRRRSRRWVRP